MHFHVSLTTRLSYFTFLGLWLHGPVHSTCHMGHIIPSRKHQLAISRISLLHEHTCARASTREILASCVDRRSIAQRTAPESALLLAIATSLCTATWHDLSFSARARPHDMADAFGRFLVFLAICGFGCLFKISVHC